MKNLVVILLIASLFSQGCSEEDLCLIGSGAVTEYQLNVDDFESVSLIGPVNLRLTQAPNLEVTVEAEPEIFSALFYEVKNGRLEIGIKENIRCFETDLGVWVNIAIPTINNITTSGVSDIASEGDIDLEQLAIDVFGTSNIQLSGQVNDLSMKVSGVLNATNFDLLTNNTTIDVSGSGDFEISCSNNLDLDVSGVANVAYKGNPTITKDISGTLNLINAN